MTYDMLSGMLNSPSTD